MRVVEIIEHKRDGASLSRDEIAFFVSGIAAGHIPDYQASALLMAMFLRGLSDEETAWLTEAMVASGRRVDLSSIPGVKVGKHSTGGVGDKTSIVVAPIVAACGVPVPKSSGRALGHTGGTVDKLEAIPGFRVALSTEAFLDQVRTIGCAFTGQTADIAPADKKLYALRDVTATIESIPLIASSIMSKKIAEGTDALVLDVKVGRGAFMKTEADARALARTMVAIGTRVGLRTQALLTAMDAPLGRAIGNALEIAECIATLQARGPRDLETICLALAARMLWLGGAARDVAAAEGLAREAVSSGTALVKFRQLVERQGGDPAIVDDPGRLPRTVRVEPLQAERSGFVFDMHAERLGRASMALGAGRDRVETAIDPGAGILLHRKPGDPVAAGEPLLEFHVGDAGRLDEARALASGAITIADAPPALMPLILGVVEAETA